MDINNVFLIIEYNFIVKNDVWDCVEIGGELDSRGLYKMKHVTNGSVEKYNARGLF